MAKDSTSGVNRRRGQFILKEEAHKRFIEAAEKAIKKNSSQAISNPHQLSKALRGRVKCDPNTIRNVWERKPVQKINLCKIADAVGLKIKEDDMYRPSEEIKEESGRPNSPKIGKSKPKSAPLSQPVSNSSDLLVVPGAKPKIINDWTVEAPLSDWRHASNGLQYRIFRLRNRNRNRVARGKCYDIEHLTTDNQASIKTNINRHCRVVEQLADNKVSGIPYHIDAFAMPAPPAETTRWWIVDQWIEGQELSQVIENFNFSSQNISDLARSLMEIICELHQVGVIVRDLSPESIIIQKSDSQPFIVDFELAKLLSAQSSVSSSTWSKNPYRAPEIEDSDPSASTQADLYSWAMIVLAVATHKNSPSKEMLPQCKEKLPHNLYKQLEVCLSGIPDERPTSAQSVLDALSNSLFKHIRKIING